MKSVWLLIFVVLLNPMKGDSQKLRIMAYNIHHGCDAQEKLQLEQMADLIKKSNAEIVGLSEVDSVCNRSENTDQAKVLSQLTGMHYTYVRHFVFDGGSYGLALLSKYPISETKNIRLPVSTDKNGNTRAFLTAKLMLPKNKELIAGVAHLDYRTDVSRMNQTDIIINMFKEEKVPVLLLGDLNAGPDSKEILKLKKLFIDTNQSDYFTFPEVNPKEKIDYILINKSHYKKTLREPFYAVKFSDHLPIFSTVQLK